jgi:hypothetical protein
MLTAHHWLLVQSFPVRIRPGAPHQVQLLACHPFTDQTLPEEHLQATQLLPGMTHVNRLPAARVSTGDALPRFKVCIVVWCGAGCMVPAPAVAHPSKAWHHDHRLAVAQG